MLRVTSSTRSANATGALRNAGLGAAEHVSDHQSRVTLQRRAINGRMTANRFEEQVVRVKRVWEVRVAGPLLLSSVRCAVTFFAPGVADIRTLLSRKAGDFVQVSSSSRPSPLFPFILRFWPFDLTFSH